jgi:integrase
MPLLVRNIREHKSGRVDYRLTIPKELRPFVPGGVSNFIRSLGNADGPEFGKRLDAAKSEGESLLTRARKQRDGAYDRLDAPTIASLAEVFRIEQLEVDEAARWDAGERELYKGVAAALTNAGVEYSSAWTGMEGRRWALKAGETVEAALSRYRRLRADGDLGGIEALWRDDALELADARGLVIDIRATEAIQQLCRAINDAAIRAAEDKMRRLDGEDVATPPEPVRGSAAPKKEAESRVPLLSTYDAYSAASGMTAGVREEWRRYIIALVAFLGHDDAARVTADDLMAWRDKLLSEPSSKGTMRKPVTVRDKYLRAVQAMFRWAKDERKLSENVAAAVKVKVPKSIKLRERDFTDEEARRILEASLKPANNRLSTGYALARRWIPWLCAYTGARVNEMSQLRGEDVQMVDGVWTIRITPEAGTVKNKAARTVPLHSHLVEQGFPAIVAKHGSGPLFYDPTKQRADKEGNRHFKKVGERLADWVRKDVGITDPELQPNHGWRHTFKTLAVAADIQERVSDAITGHAPKTVGQTYGRVPLSAMVEAIERIPRFAVGGVSSG